MAYIVRETGTKGDTEDGPPAKVVPTGVPTTKKPVGVPPKAGAAKVDLATRAEIQKWFEKTYLTIGIACALVRPMTSQSIIANASKCADANTDLIMSDAKLRAAMTKLMVVGKYSAVIAAHLPILLVAFAESRPEDKRDSLLGFATLLEDPTVLLADDDDSND